MLAQLNWRPTPITLAGMLAAAALLTGCPQSAGGDSFGKDLRGVRGDSDEDDASDEKPKAGRPKPGKDEQACGSRGLKPCSDGQFCDYPKKAECGESDAPGVCRDIPDACTLQYDPVCGCDGHTYGNACEAASQGVAVRKDGECDEEQRDCGGLAGLPCDDGEYCKYAPDALCGAADATGVCEPKPDACTEQYQPVCGCDDKTYGNACMAAAAGVSVVRDGECGTACGGLTGLQCEDGEYCKYAPDALCGAADATGVCEAKPDACTKEYKPVCGCDDKTYGNACTAAAAGVSVVHDGECGMSGGETCGGIAGLACDDDEYCNYAPDALCGAADATGVCEPKPRVCTREYRPVCGCDDKTYGNPCEAAAAGVSVVREGECGQTCGGLAGLQCPDGQYCKYAPDAACGAADATGLCASQPDVCTDQYQPVCGCDDKTYGNECEAAAAGVSVVHDGECSDGGGTTCGGLLGARCDDDEYCDYAADALCGRADATGTCKPKPDVCTLDYRPVCGCDGETYPNACAANSDGVSVESQGECP